MRWHSAQHRLPESYGARFKRQSFAFEASPRQARRTQCCRAWQATEQGAERRHEVCGMPVNSRSAQRLIVTLVLLLLTALVRILFG